jgi:hypothetical protein
VRSIDGQTRVNFGRKRIFSVLYSHSPYHFSYNVHAVITIMAVADPEISKGGDAPEKGGGGPSPNIAKTSRSLGLKS